MSRRFGRNQKRAMREEISRLERILTRTEKQCANATAALEPFREVMDNAVRTLGKYHFALPPRELQMQLGQKYVELPYRQLNYPPNFQANDGALRTADLVVNRIELAIAKGSVKRDEITGDVHASVRFPDGTNGYAVSSVENLRYMPTEFLVEQMSRMIADGIVKCTERDRRY